MNRRGPTRIERVYLHVKESEVDRGRSPEEAARIASATVNKYRASRGKTLAQGGNRRAWYPGKEVEREVFRCLKHDRVFETKRGLLAHYRGGGHR